MAYYLGTHTVEHCQLKCFLASLDLNIYVSIVVHLSVFSCVFIQVSYLEVDTKLTAEITQDDERKFTNVTRFFAILYFSISYVQKLFSCLLVLSG